MLRGIGKQVVVLKNTDSKLFEQAIFILRENGEVDKKDLLTECENIINNNSNKKIISNKIKSNKLIKILLLINIVLISIFSVLLIINLL